MNEFFKNRLDTAHALIDENQYEVAVEIIQNLKTRIHDTTVLTQINMHDNETDKEYNIRFQNISMKAGDPTQSYVQLLMLKKWKAQEYLKYYDHMLREHDVQ
jgi:hypothetical protein